MEKSLGEIMHGLSEENIAREEELFENMPVFPRISRSKNLTMLLVHRVKSCTPVPKGCDILAEGLYVDENYTYRYLDYRHVFTEKPNRGNLSIRLRFVNENTLRVTMAEGFCVPENRTEMIGDMEETECSVTCSESEDQIVMTTGCMTAVIQKSPWNLSVKNRDGEVIYRQFGRDCHSFMPYEICPMGFLFDRNTKEQYACEAAWSDPYEEFYGLGENFTSVSRKGRLFDLWNTNSLGVNTERGYKYIPFYMSSRGYGIFYNTSRKIRCDLGATLSKASYTMVEGALLDYFLMTGDTIKDIIPAYHRLTGLPAVPPKWSFGIWMSKISYGTREEVERVAGQMRSSRLPCDVIHIDTDWFTENWVCDWKFDEKKFPKVEEMIEKLHQDGYKLSLWQLPYIERGKTSYEVYDEAAANGYFAGNPDGDLQFPHGLIDFTNPEAVHWYKEKLIKPLLRKGVDVIKVDFGESAPAFFKYAGADGRDMHNLYALLYNKAAYEAAKEELGEDKALIWARSAWAGSQKYPVHWGGDAGTDFGSLASSVKGCLNLSLSGIPFWSSDIGGFWFESSPELYIRWLEFGMFCSHARFHGFYSREPWDFGQQAVDVYRKYAGLRYRLIPYIYNQALAVREEDTLIHRPVFYDYPSDLNAAGLDTQYLFGKELMVIPVLNEDNSVRIYLPRGQWTDFYDDTVEEGGKWMEQVVPLDKIPVYVKENAIIPMGPEMEYIGQKEDDQWEIHCYPTEGKGRFCSYEHGFTVEMDASDDRVKIDCTRTDMNLTFVLHNIRPAGVQADGQDIDFRMDHKRTYIHMGNRMQDHDIHMVIEKGEQ